MTPVPAEMKTALWPSDSGANQRDVAVPSLILDQQNDVKLPADGDLSPISDADLGAMHEAYVAEAAGLAEHPEDFDVARATELTERIAAPCRAAAT